MSLIEGVDFNSWLDHEFQLDRSGEPPSFGCTQCGAAPSLYPFIGEYCALCLARMYGSFRRSQEIALWLEKNSWLWKPGGINDKASAINYLGGEDPLPHAHETDEEFEERRKAMSKRRDERLRKMRRR